MNKLKEYFNSLPEVTRIKELENYIDSNKRIQDTFTLLKNKQKQMINAKEFNQIKQYNEYSIEYEEMKKTLLDLPFVEEYIELLEIINEKLIDLTAIIENKLNKIMNNYDL